MKLLKKKNITRKDIDKYNCRAFDTYNETALVKCHFCNRSFLEERMKGHFKICKKEKPFNKLEERKVSGSNHNIYENAMD